VFISDPKADGERNFIRDFLGFIFRIDTGGKNFYAKGLKFTLLLFIAD